MYNGRDERVDAMTSNLKTVLKALRKHCEKSVKDYAIPRLFKEGRRGMAFVNPWGYFADLIESTIARAPDALAHAPLAPLKGKGEGWARSAVYYSTLVRTSAAWDADASGELEDVNRFGLKETGTCLKMMALLPHLERMGVDALYLLPMFKRSLARKKGELGSPYAVADFFALDETLKDPMTGHDTDIDTEFAALVEAAHLFGIRVVIDIVPRTLGVDNVWLKDHPDWFYWVESSTLDEYRPPMVDTIASKSVATPSHAKRLYASGDVREHLKRFKPDPWKTDAELWRSIQDEDALLDVIDQRFGMTVAPAFSDVVNDDQPPWSDITALRLYLDHPIAAKAHVEQGQPPYVLQDVMKASLNPGDRPNHDLWKRLASIIPHHQKTYGIDGVRIDMGHALPEALLEAMFKAAKAVDAHVALIGEELDPSRGDDALRAGYDIIVGDAFYKIPRVEEGLAYRFFTETRNASCPVFASAETHDTPRIAQRLDQAYARAFTALSYVTPNAAPFINSAQEVYARAPMNHGLDVQNPGGIEKLALFDRVDFDYTHQDAVEIPSMLERLATLRRRYIDAIEEVSKASVIEETPPYVFGFRFETPSHTLVVIANLAKDEACVVETAAYVRDTSASTWTRRLTSRDVDARECTTQIPRALKIEAKEVVFYEVLARPQRLTE